MKLMGFHDRRKLLADLDDICRRLHDEGCHVACVVRHPASDEATVIDCLMGPAAGRKEVEAVLLTDLVVRFMARKTSLAAAELLPQEPPS